MWNSESISLEDDEAQRVVILWRPNLSRTDDSAARGVRGGADGTGACSRRNLPRTGQTGAEVGIRVAAAGSGQVRIPGRGGGRKTEILEN